MLNDIEEMLDEVEGRSLKEIEDEFIKRTGFEQVDIIHDMFTELKDFIFTDPRIPDPVKKYISVKVPVITTESTREEIIDEIHNLAEDSELCMLTLYAYRQMDVIDWLPFVKAAIERNPVCLSELNDKTLPEVIKILKSFSDQSIYDGKRIAMPDEVWNYRRGDGIEKAFVLADYILLKDQSFPVTISIDNKYVTVSYKETDFNFRSEKKIKKIINIEGNKYIIE
jgi:hypothetical protein